MIKKFDSFDKDEIINNEREYYERELNARKKYKQEQLFNDIPFNELEMEIKDEISKDGDYHLSIGRKKIEADGYEYSYHYIQYDSENLGRTFIYLPDDNSTIGYFEFNGRNYTEDADTIRIFYHYLKQLIKHDPVKDNDDLITDFEIYESLKDKMIGKNYNEILKSYEKWEPGTYFVFLSKDFYLEKRHDIGWIGKIYKHSGDFVGVKVPFGTMSFVAEYGPWSRKNVKWFKTREEAIEFSKFLLKNKSSEYIDYIEKINNRVK